MPELVKKIDTAFCLTAEVEIDSSTRSGFRCAQRQRTAGFIWGLERYLGIAAMQRMGFARRLVIVGGHEDRYPSQGIERAEAFKRILELDLDVRCEIIARTTGATSVTLDAMSIMRDMMAETPENAVVTSWYHVPRTELQLAFAGLPLRVYSAEAFMLAEGSITKEELAQRFGNGDLGSRMVDELSGIAALLTGSYRPRR